MFELRTLGSLTLTGDAGVPIALPRRRLALLAVLAAGGDRGVTRERIVSVFWPDHPAAAGRHSLDQLLSLVRRDIADSTSLGVDPLRLNPGVVACDIARFEQAVAINDLATAVGNYGGPFLDGFYLRDAGEFERWTEAERARLGQRFHRALRELARLATERGDGFGAAERWRQLVASDPLDSAATLGLMHALAATGDRPGAIRHARVYELLVREQLEMGPDPSITAFTAELSRESPATDTKAAVVVIEPSFSGAVLPDAATTGGRHGEFVSTVAQPRRPRPKRSLTAASVVGALLLTATIFWRAGAHSPPPMVGTVDAPVSVAVLPVIDLGTDHNDEVLSEELTEEMASALHRVPGVRVAARSSSYFYQDKKLTSRQIGENLAVNFVVEGSFEHDGDRIRVHVQLVDVASGFLRWDETYGRDAGTTLDSQEGLAQSIVDTLTTELTHRRPPATDARRTTSDAVAFDLYARGRYFWNHRTGPSLQRAADYFRQSLTREPDFALAWDGLADTYSMMAIFGAMPPTAAFPLAEQAALRALALDSTRAEVHASLAIINMFYEWNWPEAERQFKRAITLDPRYATAHLFYGHFFECQGRPLDALREVHAALALEPVSVIIATRLGSMLTKLSGSEAAITPLRQAIELDSLDPNPRINLSLVYSLLGRNDSALAELPPLGVNLAGFEGGLQVYVQERAGRHSLARQTLAGMEHLRQSRYVSGEAMAVAYLAVGQRERALAELDRALAEHSFTLVFAKRNQVYEPLHGDPRFEHMLRVVGVK